MKRRSNVAMWLVLTSMTCVCAVTMELYADDSEVTAAPAPAIEQTRIDMLQQALADRNSIREEMLASLKEIRPSDSVEGLARVAIEVAGAYRFVEAVPSLMPLIESEATFVLRESLQRNYKEQQFPAVGALIKIGKPAADTCLYAVARSPSAVALSNMCWVVGRVYGPDTAATLLEQRANNSELRDDEVAQYREAMKVLKELYE